MKTSINLVIFLILITILLSISGFYLHYRIINLTPWLKNYTIYIKFSILFFLVLQLFGPLTYRLWPSHQNFPFILQWLTYITLGFFSSLLFYFIFAEIFNFILMPLFNPVIVDERRVFIGVSILTFLNGYWGFKNAVSDPVIENIDIPFPDLPPDLVNLRCLQISDLHVGPTIDKSYVERLVQISNLQNPDLIFLTGDLCDGTVDHLKDQIEPLKKLKSKFGIFYITGNHEYYWDGQAWIDYFKSCNFTVLLNSHQVIKIGNAQLSIGGCTDLKAETFISEHKCDAIKTISAMPENSFKLLLAHQPNTFKQFANSTYKVDLQLSGHTHGGQFFPWSIAVYAAQKYIKGLYLEDKTYIYVNRGTGYWGPPFRFPEKSEVTLITFIKGNYK